MLDQMQSVAIEHIKMKDMVGCSNHWSFHNTFHYTLTLTTTVGSTIVPSTSKGIVLPFITRLVSTPSTVKAVHLNDPPLSRQFIFQVVHFESRSLIGPLL